MALTSTSRQDAASGVTVGSRASAGPEEPKQPGFFQRAAAWLKGVLFAIPGLRLFVRAVQGYIFHQSASQAGSVAFSAVLSMFPLLLLVSATAAYIGQPGDAATLAARVIGYTPPVVRDTLQPVVQQVIGQRNQALLAIGLVVTLWTASSGMQAVRTGLNKAYGVERGLSFWRARIKVTLFTVIVGLATILAFSSVVVMPYIWMMINTEPDVAHRRAVAALRRALRQCVRRADHHLRADLWLAARHSAAAADRLARCIGGGGAVGRRRRAVVGNVAQRQQVDTGLRQLRWGRRDPGLSVCECATLLSAPSSTQC
jgi:hypothetical protein